MPRRAVLSVAERSTLCAIPTDEGKLIRHYTFDEQDLALIHQRRGGHNRLGFAVHLCYLRFPGYALPHDATPPPGLLAWVARQLDLKPDLWPQYARRAETRREHLRELQFWLGLTPFDRDHFRAEVEPPAGAGRADGSGDGAGDDVGRAVATAAGDPAAA